MKPTTPHDPRHDALDDLIAAALHGDLSPAERAQFDSRIANDPAAQAAYHEAQAMNDLLEKTHQTAQPDPAFEQRMVSAVRRKLQTESHRETAWESASFFYRWIKQRLSSRWFAWEYGAIGSVAVVVVGLCYAVWHDVGVMNALGDNGIASPAAVRPRFYLPPSLYADAFKRRNVGQRLAKDDLKRVIDQAGINYAETAQKGITLSGYVDSSYAGQFGGKTAKFGNGAVILSGANTYTGGSTISGDALEVTGGQLHSTSPIVINSGGTYSGTSVTTAGVGSLTMGGGSGSGGIANTSFANGPAPAAKIVLGNTESEANSSSLEPVTKLWNESADKKTPDATNVARIDYGKPIQVDGAIPAESDKDQFNRRNAGDRLRQAEVGDADKSSGKPAAAPPAVDERKLIRNAQLELEVKSFQAAMDQITALTRGAGGYVDTSNSQKGGNGKLQGTVVVKVLPQNLDAFLLKLRDLGQVQNQSVSTDDVTKAYFDTQARLENSRRMEAQLQDLLKHANSKVSDLLQVERELGRVRGEIEQMQGQLKLYDFQVQYATVTMQMKEKDLNQTAAYLLKEQDDFSLFATDVEGTFQHARQTAESFKAQVLTANLNHHSGSDVSAELVVTVAPDQVEAFLTQVRGLGRVANFTRQTQRVAKDGGDSDQPADQTLTEKDKVQVHLAIRSDDETRKQVALTVVAKAIDDALDRAKTAAQASAGAEVLSSSLNKTPQGQSTAQLSVRVPGKDYTALMTAFKALGRTASLSIQRNDNSGPGANGDDAPVIISLSLTDDDTPLQQTALSVLADNVDAHAQQIKKDAATAGVEVKASSFQRQPDGTELAQMTFRLPMAKYAAFVESVKALGKVESLTVRRDDRPDQTVADDTAPVEINLVLHNQADIVAPDNGLFATLRHTFGEGAGALFSSIRIIGVLIAFVLPWLVTVVLLAWVGRRIYIMRKK